MLSRFAKVLFPILAIAVSVGCAATGSNSAVPAQPLSSNITAATPIVTASSQNENVGTNRSVFVAFSRDIDPTTLTPQTFYIEGIAGSVSYDSANRIAYFKPNTELSYDTFYNVNVTTGIKDTKGTAMPVAYNFRMHTRASLDTSNPTVELLPGCVNPNGPVRVVFDEAMDSTTINTSTFVVDGVSGSITYDSVTRIASFYPASPFTAGSSYNGTITTGAKELSGVSLAADYNFTFTICSTPPPPPEQNFCSYTRGGYQGGGTPGQLFDTYYTEVFFGDLTLGINDGAGPQHHTRFTGTATGAAALKQYLVSPAMGPSTALPSDSVNPTTTNAGDLPTQVAALTLNVGFSGYGPDPAGFGNLYLTGTGTSLDGASVYTVLAATNQALAGNGLPVGFTFSSLNDLITNLNQSYDNCTQSNWATTHLTTTPPTS